MLKTIFSVFMLCFVTMFASAQQAQKTMPAVNVKTLDGKSVNIQDYAKKGKITVVSFWATWCSPCKKELDAIAENYAEWQKNYDLELVAVTIDDARALSKVKPMVEQKGWKYKILSDINGDLKRAFNVQSVPFSILIDKKGNIAYTHSGYSPGDENDLEAHIKMLK